MIHIKVVLALIIAVTTSGCTYANRSLLVADIETFLSALETVSTGYTFNIKDGIYNDCPVFIDAKGLDYTGYKNTRFWNSGSVLDIPPPGNMITFYKITNKARKPVELAGTIDNTIENNEY